MPFNINYSVRDLNKELRSRKDALYFVNSLPADALAATCVGGVGNLAQFLARRIESAEKLGNAGNTTKTDAQSALQGLCCTKVIFGTLAAKIFAG